MQIVYKVRIKEDSVGLFGDLIKNTLIPEAYKLSGCELFSVYQNTDNEREFIFHETWRGEKDVHVYKQNLIDILGDPHPDEEFPAQMNDMIEADEDLI